MKLTGRNPGAGGARGKSMPPAKGNAIPPRALKGGGVDDTGGDSIANTLTRLNLDERPPHSAMNPVRNAEDVLQPGPRREQAEQGKPLGMRIGVKKPGLRGTRRLATR